MDEVEIGDFITTELKLMEGGIGIKEKLRTFLEMLEKKIKWMLKNQTAKKTL